MFLEVGSESLKPCPTLCVMLVVKDVSVLLCHLLTFSIPAKPQVNSSVSWFDHGV